ncbi:MAG: hypothetical protein ACRDQ5_19240, partial [Sciscionella sp.]
MAGRHRLSYLADDTLTVEELAHRVRQQQSERRGRCLQPAPAEQPGATGRRMRVVLSELGQGRDHQRVAVSTRRS